VLIILLLQVAVEAYQQARVLVVLELEVWLFQVHLLSQ
jgi:hypothetical protein